MIAADPPDGSLESLEVLFPPLLNALLRGTRVKPQAQQARHRPQFLLRMAHFPAGSSRGPGSPGPT